MGYTRYWSRTDKPIDQDLVDYVNKVIKDCREKGISIKGWDGYEEPKVTLEEISINGDGNLGHEHETFEFENKITVFDFCKTARKPYDYAVRTILKYAEENGFVEDVSSDGENEDIVSDVKYSVWR